MLERIKNMVFVYFFILVLTPYTNIPKLLANDLSHNALLGPLIKCWYSNISLLLFTTTLSKWSSGLMRLSRLSWIGGVGVDAAWMIG